jgi:putative sporulation protein YyaC
VPDLHDDKTEELGMSINYSDINAIELISDYIVKFLGGKVLIMCIGTDKCIGDCLAPLVGSMLVKNNYSFPVVGTLDNPVHAINIQSVIKKTKSKYPEHFTIAIDACIGLIDCVGDIQIKSCPIYPGKGVGKSLPHIGDISIVGVVDTLDTSDLFTIRNIRLSFVMKMAEVIANSLMIAVDKVNKLAP